MSQSLTTDQPMAPRRTDIDHWQLQDSNSTESVAMISHPAPSGDISCFRLICSDWVIDVHSLLPLSVWVSCCSLVLWNEWNEFSVPPNLDLVAFSLNVFFWCVAICVICLSSSWCRGLVWGLWLWNSLFILTCNFCSICDKRVCGGWVCLCT